MENFQSTIEKYQVVYPKYHKYIPSKGSVDNQSYTRFQQMGHTHLTFLSLFLVDNNQVGVSISLR